MPYGKVTLRKSLRMVTGRDEEPTPFNVIAAVSLIDTDELYEPSSRVINSAAADIERFGAFDFDIGTM